MWENMKLLPYQGIVSLNGSKSIIQRIMLIASLQPMLTKLHPGSVCEDVLEMTEALRVVGGQVSFDVDSMLIDSKEIAFQSSSDTVVKFKASATAFRFWLARSILVKAKTNIMISGQLYSRPLEPFLDTLKAFGCIVNITDAANAEYTIKIEITPPALMPSEITVNGSISSQFISGLMLMAPVLEEGLTIIFRQKPVSYDYIQLTANLLKQLNISCCLNSDKAIIKSNSKFKIPDIIEIEPDISGAAFFLALGSFSKEGIGIRNYTDTRWQPDWKIISILREMGVSISETEERIMSKAGTLTGISIGMDNNPDLVPLIAVLALFAESPTVLRAISRLQYKESDRIKGLTNAFDLIGVNYKYESGNLTINPLTNAVNNVTLDTQNDHRLIMAFSLLKLQFPQIRLTETETVNKSFPEFFQTLAALSV